MRPRLVAALLVAVSSLPRAPAQTDASAAPTLVLPPRAAAAAAGSALAAQLTDVPLAEREDRIWSEFAAGNVPSFLRQLVPVEFTGTVDGEQHHATIWCTPDWLGVGADDDWLRVPMTPRLAQRLADRLDAVLPTRRLVDAIAAAAAVRIAPFPFHPKDHDIMAWPLFVRHHDEVERQLAAASPDTSPDARPHGRLVVGAHKDLVLSPLLAEWPTRVCIYGWHRLDRTAIQPLSKVHGSTYVDYSHGTRLVARRMLVDGEPRDLAALLGDPRWSTLVSDEGPLPAAHYPRPHGERSLRLVTWNIHHGRGLDDKVDVARIADELRTLDADVVCLQEVDRGVRRSGGIDLTAEIARRLGMYQAFGKNIDYQGGDYGNATLSRWPIREAVNHHYRMLRPNEQRGVLCVRIDVQGRPLHVLNTHIDYRPDDAERRSNASELLDLLSSFREVPAVLAGDFNDLPGRPVHELLTSRWRDALSEHPLAERASYPAEAPTKAIDWVLWHGEALTPNTGNVTPSAASDHRPVVVEFAWR